MPTFSSRARFPTTRWSALVGARSTEEGERRRSLEALIAAYWKPVYKHVRLKWNKSRDDAQDLTQGFFALAIEKSFFDGYDPEKARFRTFVRLCLDRFVANEEESRRRLKRGGGIDPLPLDFEAAETELSHCSGSPEEAFDREWQRSLFTLAIEALRAQCAQDKRFLAFERYDLGDRETRPSYAELAAELDVPVTTITNHLAWARRELRRLVLEQLAAISADENDYRSEAQRLFGV
ncbi:MAG TPA: sigma-70 family RNA polymerase sigma factor [Polyangiaceae bacterium]|nr:sigma-70 family RNA polymerase sigma factor [Polyangiaceae bacterium]